MEDKMKQFVLFIVISLFIIKLEVSANPVTPKYFSEIQFRESGWIIELFIMDLSAQPDSAYITSKSDTAYLKPGCLIPYDYCLLTNDSLLSNLEIDPMNDTISLYLNIYNISFPDDQMIIGKLPLEPSQSLCRKVGDSYTPDIWYIDNSPTLGFENDTVNAMGNIQFNVIDTPGSPIPFVDIYLGIRFDGSTWGDSIIITTDSVGFIDYHYYATTKYFKFLKDGYIEKDTVLMLYPDSIITATITLEPAGQGINNSETQIASNFYLSRAYPNPFNNSTNFHYTLPEDGFVILSVFSLTGGLVAELFKGYRYAGNYRVNWNAGDIPSGIYLINLTTRNRSIQRKCILLK